MIFLKRRISKNIVCKQKTKLIEKTTSNISKHLFMFLFQQISENGKKEIERKCSVLYQKVTDGNWKSKKREQFVSYSTNATTHLQLYFYISALPLFKSFVLVFEQKEPMVHRFHDELKETLISFLAYFLKTEKVKSISTKKCSK